MPSASTATGTTSMPASRAVATASSSAGSSIARRRLPWAASNAQMTPKDIKTFVPLDTSCKELLKMAMSDLNLSARAYDRILKVSRTIADLASAEQVDAAHLSEAIGYRNLDRQLWG